MLADSVADQACDGLETHLAHDSRAVCLDSLDADVEVGCDFLVRSAERDQTDNFALTPGQDRRRLFVVV